ncbi:MAG: DNA primase [Methylophilaceae bacterium]|nr:DNA primase [Methylophilaceae bacterium]
MIPETFIQDLLNRIDIVNVIDKSVPLKKVGANYAACCPFHNEKSPSFTVSATKQFYHCFGCGAHGTAVGFLMEYHGLSFVEGIQELAKMAGMIVPQEERSTNSESYQAAKLTVVGLQESLQQATEYYKAELKQSQRAIDYLKGRGLSGKIAAKFQIGYAPAGWQNLQAIFRQYDNEVLTTAGLVITNEKGKRYDRFRDRIMFPIHDQKGQVIGFGGRVINPEDTPKYYNSPETPLFQKGHELYGLFLARRAIRDGGRALVVEGYMDVVALAQYDIHYAVAALGTATTPFHIAKLMRQTDEIVFCFDGDNAGRTAAWRAAMNALPALIDGLKLTFMFLPQGHDPDSYVREFGKENLEAEMKMATPLSAYIIDHLCEDNALQSQEDKVKFLNDAEPILHQMQAPRLSIMLRKRVSELAGVTGQELQDVMRLSSPNKPPTRASQKQLRTPQSIKKRFALSLLMKPSLANADDLTWLQGNAEEDYLVRNVLEIALQQPQSNPAVLLRGLENKIDERLLREVQRDLHMLDESLDIALEFNGARTQLRDMMQSGSSAILLNRANEKPISALTEHEREQLVNAVKKLKR